MFVSIKTKVMGKLPETGLMIRLEVQFVALLYILSWIPLSMCSKPVIKIGAIIPKNIFVSRGLTGVISATIAKDSFNANLSGSYLLEKYDIDPHPVIMKMPTPVMPSDTLNFLCEEMVNKQVSRV